MSKRRLTLIEILAVFSLFILLLPFFSAPFLNSRKNLDFSHSCSRFKLIARTALLSSLCGDFFVKLKVNKLGDSYVFQLVSDEANRSFSPVFSKIYPLKGVSEVLVKQSGKYRPVQDIEIFFPFSIHDSKRVDAFLLKKDNDQLEISLGP
ncbi:hypothetical protein [Candidatus Similichlamydia epinepheli]|uniref:hypothetical protein n=1 Tax=Candidatus Similichlamydia epinepheli TaxID=1903953 RepID=UPI000D3CC182|nr:hypothetical protein [Candidatus Similichlamydia epinepheli]